MAARPRSQLKFLTLRTHNRAVDVEKSLQQAISTWTSLETLKLPLSYLRPSILEAIASLPNLTTLAQVYDFGSAYDEAAILQKLPDKPFPKLKIFGFDSDPGDAYRLAQRHAEFFAGLMTIRIRAHNKVGNSDLKFVRQVGGTCPRLRCLSLNLCILTWPGSEIPPLPVEVIENVFPCHSLETLEIGHPLPISLNETDVERMAAAWPKLDALHLCNEPDFTLHIPADMGNSLSILSAFAKHFPRMGLLGLFFTKDKVVRFSGDLYPEHQCHKLEEICVRLSPVPGEDAHDVGFFIASLCGREPTLVTGESEWYMGTIPPDWPNLLVQ